MKLTLFLLIFIFLRNIIYGQTAHTVLVSDFEFDPKNLTIAIGDTVKWEWVEGSHTTTSDSTTGLNSWNSPINSNERTFSFIFTTSGLHRYYCIPHGSPGGSGMSGSIQVESAVTVESGDISAVQYNLEQNYPNPFNPSTTIKLSVPVSGNTTVIIFDLLGQKVTELFTGYLERGMHEFIYTAEAQKSGVYFCQVTSKGDDGTNFTELRKMTLLK